jgi:hypothetical protein
MKIYADIHHELVSLLSSIVECKDPENRNSRFHFQLLGIWLHYQSGSYGISLVKHPRITKIVTKKKHLQNVLPFACKNIHVRESLLHHIASHLVYVRLEL